MKFQPIISNPLAKSSQTILLQFAQKEYKLKSVPSNSTIIQNLGLNARDSFRYLADLFNVKAIEHNAIEKLKRIKRNEKAKAKRAEIKELRNLTLEQVPTPEFFQRNKYHISEHTYSYNIKIVPIEKNGVLYYDYAKKYGFKFGLKKNIKTVRDCEDNILSSEDKEETKWRVFLEKATIKLYNQLIALTQPGSLFRIYIHSEEHTTVSTELLEYNSFSYSDFLHRFFDQYSNYRDLFEGKWVVALRSIISGGGSLANVPNFLKKRGISIVYNDDNYCGQRCLALADAKNNDDFKNMKKNNEVFKQMWSKRAVSISEEIDVKGRMSLTDFDKWADLRHKQVIILSELFLFLYSTEIEYPEKVYIYYDSTIEHYHFIHNINAATNDSSRNSKWCSSCHKSFRFDNGAFANHKCVENSCWFCKENFGCKEACDNHFHNACWVHCGICNCVCPTNDCKQKHETICKGKRIRCDKCSKYINKDHYADHKCGEEYCTVCQNYFIGKHRCYIQPLPILEPKKYDTWVYDFESRFDNNIHIVNKCVAAKLFTDEVFICNTIDEFVEFVLSKKEVTFIAHNGKAYDTWMVHKYLIRNTNKRPNKLILAGNKIMYMKVKSIRFIDSLNHVAQALETFPKTFGIKELKKGFFPYLFNTNENAGYKGVIPDIKYFSPDSMKHDKKNEFIKWYDTQKNIEYDFDKELLEYCISDVIILKKAMEIHINNGITLNGLNPIGSPTIASYAMKVFRTNFLKQNKICVLKKDEYDFCKRGFFGGRTEVFQLKAIAEDVDDGKFIKYQDIQSLYPTVQFFDMLPCGEPKWDLEPVVDDIVAYLNSHFGYVECDIICPKNLHIPLLGEKKDGKLMFDLVNKGKAVYSTVELLRAVELGYKITKVYRGLSFDKCDDLFKGYVQTFLKIKTESNGYDGDDIDDYIQRYYEHCGVMLDKTKIIKNPGMKLIAKILLNSLWGKFGQKDDLATTEYYTDPDKWFRLLAKHITGEIMLKNETMIDENTIYVQYVSKDTKTSSLNTTNLGLAAFVTAQARLRLYSELYKLGTRAIYCDTDSIIFHYDKDKYNIPEGDMLGEWEPETDSPIIEVLALAPKSYAYKCLDGSGDIKCKGITLNYNNSKKFNHNSLAQLIDGTNTKGFIETDKMEFIKDNKTGQIRTKNTVKVISFSPDSFKRTINYDFTTTARE